MRLLKIRSLLCPLGIYVICKHTCSIIRISFIFDWCQRSKAAVVPVKYECDVQLVTSVLIVLRRWLLALNPAWINKLMPSKGGTEITYPFPNSNGCTVEVCGWTNHLDVISYPWLSSFAPTVTKICHLRRDKSSYTFAKTIIPLAGRLIQGMPQR